MRAARTHRCAGETQSSLFTLPPRWILAKVRNLTLAHSTVLLSCPRSQFGSPLAFDTAARRSLQRIEVAADVQPIGGGVPVGRRRAEAVIPIGVVHETDIEVADGDVTCERASRLQPWNRASVRRLKFSCEVQVFESIFPSSSLTSLRGNNVLGQPITAM